jgi:hypothetical protein
MIAKLAYLTTPGPDRFVLNIQPFGSDDVLRFEIAKAHLANILIDGASLALREYSKPSEDLKKGAIQATLKHPSDSDISAPVQNRVPVTTNTESADGHASAGSQRTA